MTLVDAGPLVALADRDEPDHLRCAEAFPRLQRPLRTTEPVLTEAMYLLGDRIGWPAQERLWKLVLGDDLELLALERPVLRRAHDLMHQYHDLPMDFADATLVAVAESIGVTRIFTLDDDFGVYRLFGRKPFDIIP